MALCRIGRNVEKIQSEVGKHLQNIANENNELTGMACGHGSDVGNRVIDVGVVGGPDDIRGQ